MVADPSFSFNFLTKLALNCPSFRKQSRVKLFAQPDINKFSESEVTCGQVWWPILRICALQLTHPKWTHTQQWTHTHTPWTHNWSSWQPFMLQRPGNSWGFDASHLSRGIEGGRERWLFTTKSKWLDNWDCLGFWGIKKWVNFYHCRVVVSTHCKDTFICKWRYFASTVSFKIKILSS